MARSPSLQRIADEWPFAFAGAVGLWFVVAGIGASGLLNTGSDDKVGDRTGSSPSIESPASTSSDSGSDDADYEKSSEPSGVAAGAVEVRVKSFRIDEDRKSGGLQAEFTLEVKDLLKENVDFTPSQLKLRRTSDGKVSRPQEDMVMGVSPKLPIIAPVTFDITPRPGASYELSYGGRTLYTGPPF
jgi:hypothetical protein